MVSLVAFLRVFRLRYRHRLSFPLHCKYRLTRLPERVKSLFFGRPEPPAVARYRAGSPWQQTSPFQRTS